MRAPVSVLAVLLLAGCTATAPDVGAPTSPAGSSAPSPGAEDGSPPSAPGEDPAVEARRLLTDADAAAGTRPDDLRVAVATAMAGDLAGLVADPWEDRVLEGLPGWPVTVGEATVGLDGEVGIDVVVDAPPDDDGALVLRWLAAAPALGDAVGSLAVEVDGEPTDVEVDRPGARLVVPVSPGEGHVVRVRADYTVPDRGTIVDDGTPAGYGLLASTADAVMLGHWLPVVALPGDDGPMQARGDVGAFPPGAWSLVVHHEGTLVTGAEERECPRRETACTWVQGIGLRDVGAVVLADATSATAEGTAVHVATTGQVPGDPGPVAAEAADVLSALARDLGPLPWPTTEVVAAPIGPGAAGMEFPGLVWVDTDAWPGDGPDFGSYVLAHEFGHQWFHAVVGNGSLSAPVVDESLAQYLSVVAFDEVFGDGSGQALAARSLGGRHATAVADGVPDEAPAQPLAAFATGRSYGANVYGRGGQAWVDAEATAGRRPVLEALRVLVARFGLREVDARTVLDVVREVAPEAAPVLADGWGLDAG